MQATMIIMGTCRLYLGDFIDWWRATLFLLESLILSLLTLLLLLTARDNWGGGLGAKLGFPWLIFGRQGATFVWLFCVLNREDLLAIASDKFELFNWLLFKDLTDVADEVIKGDDNNDDDDGAFDWRCFGLMTLKTRRRESKHTYIYKSHRSLQFA